MEFTPAQFEHFTTQGFVLTPNPMTAAEHQAVDRAEQDLDAQWRARDWPKELNRYDCKFIMMGEPIFRVMEQPHFLELARQALEVDQVRIGACGLADSRDYAARENRTHPQTPWHSDGGPERKRIAIRVALDRHDQSVGPIRVLPGSHLRPTEQVREELANLELASGEHDARTFSPHDMYVKHPHEVEVILDPRWALAWTPSAWHATGPNFANAPRRAYGWNYCPVGQRYRDTQAVKLIHADTWPSWSDERKRLWGMLD